MFKIIVVIAFLFSGCLDDPPYNVEPVVEFCQDEVCTTVTGLHSPNIVEICIPKICYSNSVPLLKVNGEHANKWPIEGLDIKDHEAWCEYFGWRIPTYHELWVFNENCDSDLYNSNCINYVSDTSIIHDHFEIGTASETAPSDMEFSGRIVIKNYSDYSYFARCVKPNV